VISSAEEFEVYSYLHGVETFWHLFLFAADTKELATKSLYIQSKKFYIDMLENSRGKFIKISEVIFIIIYECELIT